MESTNDRGETNTFLMIKRSFNPAGIPFKPGSDKIMISMFDLKPRDGQAGQEQGGAQSNGGSSEGASGRSDMDDEVPF